MESVTPAHAESARDAMAIAPDFVSGLKVVVAKLDVILKIIVQVGDELSQVRKLVLLCLIG